MWTPGILRQCLACTFEPITAGCGPEGQVIENCWIRHEWPWHVDCSNTHPKISPRFLSCSDTPNPDHLFARSSVGPQQRLPAGEEVRQFRLYATCRSNFTAFWGRKSSSQGTRMVLRQSVEFAAVASGRFVRRVCENSPVFGRMMV